MKGTFFQKPLEFKVLIEGESWKQGDAVNGTLSVKNHGSESIPLNEVRIHLAHGLLRKVHARAAGAFKVSSSQAVAADALLEGQKEVDFPWSFQTDRNASVTEHLTSLFLVYGRGEELEKLGQLQLNIQPYPIIGEFLKTLEIDCRFVRKGQKSSKGWVEVKLDPPDSRAFASVEYAVLHFQFKEETLLIKYLFHLKKVQPTAASAVVTKQVREFEQQLEPHQYLLPSGRPNYEVMGASLREALDLVESKVTF